MQKQKHRKQTSQMRVKNRRGELRNSTLLFIPYFRESIPAKANQVEQETKPKQFKYYQKYLHSCRTGIY